MSFSKPWTENLAICADNLSIYYILSGVISILAVVFTWWIQCKEQKVEGENEKIGGTTKEDDEKGVDEEEDSESENFAGSMRARMDSVTLLNTVASSMSQQQLDIEKQTVRKQLENILEMLKKEQDHSEVSTIQDLHQQLSLYTTPSHISN